MKKIVKLFLLGTCLFFWNKSSVDAKYIDENIIPMVLYDPTIDYSIVENVEPIGVISNYKDTPYIGDNFTLIVYEMYEYNYETIKVLVDYFTPLVSKQSSIDLEFRIWEMTNEEIDNMSNEWGDEQMQLHLDNNNNLSFVYSDWEYMPGEGRLYGGNKCYFCISLN